MHVLGFKIFNSHSLTRFKGDTAWYTSNHNIIPHLICIELQEMFSDLGVFFISPFDESLKKAFNCLQTRLLRAKIVPIVEAFSYRNK